MLNIDFTNQLDKIKPNHTYFALPGKRFDNSLMLARSAIEKGARQIVAFKYVCENLQPHFSNVKFIPSIHPRYDYALRCQQFFYPKKKHILIGVTGSKGKTSVAFMLHNTLPDSVYIGTLGVYTNGVKIALPKPCQSDLTTPQPEQLYAIFGYISAQLPNVKHIIFEYTSIGLDASRCIEKLDLGVFTNFVPDDHLIYHHTAENYLACKQLLIAQSDRMIYPNTYPEKQSFMIFNRELVEKVCNVLGYCNPVNTFVPSRMEKITPAQTQTNQCDIFLDFAHTPYSLEAALMHLADYPARIVVFGCGGDRDAEKRHKMGQVAQKLATKIIVTDDNPRTEDPSLIRSAIIAGCMGATEIPDRKQAIRYAIEYGTTLSQCAVLILDKGHDEQDADRTTIEECCANLR